MKASVVREEMQHEPAHEGRCEFDNQEPARRM
jgi:hypothetical protein